MFYCDPCADKLGYPKTAFKSRGRCECCSETAVCNDMPSSALPYPKTMSAQEIADAERMIAELGTKGKAEKRPEPESEKQTSEVERLREALRRAYVLIKDERDGWDERRHEEITRAVTDIAPLLDLPTADDVKGIISPEPEHRNPLASMSLWKECDAGNHAWTPWLGLPTPEAPTRYVTVCGRAACFAEKQYDL